MMILADQVQSTGFSLSLTNSVVALIAFVIVLFLLFSKKMKELANAALAFKAKWVEIKEAEKAGTPPPKIHGLTMTEKIDIDKIVPRERRTPKERKPRADE